MPQTTTFFTGITRRPWTGLILVSLTILVLFAAFYASARASILNEIRHQAMGVAVAIAAAIDPADLEAVQTLDDAASPAFRRVQSLLDRVSIENPDVRYAYTMRRSQRDGASPSDYEFIVDGSPRDANQNGKIDPDEICEPIGRLYDASPLPAMLDAWYRPGADADVQPDPPYPDLMSGYAPVRNERGQPVAIVGVDITAATVRTKLFVVRIVAVAVWVILTLLITLVTHLYYLQHETLEHVKRLGAELDSRNEMLRAANTELAVQGKQAARLPGPRILAAGETAGGLSARQDRIIFDKYYLSCEMSGGDLFDVLSIDGDHVGFFLARTPARGAAGALISGLFKTAVEPRRHTVATSQLYAALDQPGAVLETVNDLIHKEVARSDAVSMAYAVLDIPRYRISIACAGQVVILRYDPRADAVAVWELPAGPGLGQARGTRYPPVEKTVAAGDKIVFTTPALTSAANAGGEPFGWKRLIEAVSREGQGTPSSVITAVRQAVEAHRTTAGTRDEGSILVAEIR